VKWIARVEIALFAQVESGGEVRDGKFVPLPLPAKQRGEKERDGRTRELLSRR